MENGSNELVEQEGVEPVPKEYKLQWDMVVNGREYKIRRPMGRMGAIHISLLTQLIPDRVDSDGTPMYRGNIKKDVSEIFKEWSATVLKHIIIEGPSIGYA